MMRRRLHRFIPVVMIALMVQIFAPIGAAWSAAIAAADPLQAAEICSTSVAFPGQRDQGTDHRVHHDACILCCLGHAGFSLDTPRPAGIAVAVRQVARVVWHDLARDVSYGPSRLQQRARAPPSFS